jgi:hypothetical protein
MNVSGKALLYNHTCHSSVSISIIICFIHSVKLQDEINANSINILSDYVSSYKSFAASKNGKHYIIVSKLM